MTKHPTYTTHLSDYLKYGMQENHSPFLKPKSRKMAKALPIKLALTSAFLLLAAFILSLPTWHPNFATSLLVLVYFISGTPALIDAFEDLSKLKINIDILMTFAAFSSLALGNGFEGGLLLVLFDISRTLEGYVTQKAHSTLHTLKQLAPEKAQAKSREGKYWKELNIQDIPEGWLIRIHSGQLIPLDGVVVEGQSQVALKHLTGESTPIDIGIGSKVYAGSENLDGALIVQTENIATKSTLSRIIEMISEAQESKPQLQRWFDNISDLYAKSIMLLCGLIALFYPMISSMSYFGTKGSIYRALSFLIAASPCALIIAVPIAYLSALNASARRGILLKGTTTFDALAKCRAIAFDKTGTLTKGQLQVESIQNFTHEGEVGSFFWPKHASWLLSMQTRTTHPIAHSLTRYLQEQAVVETSVQQFQTVQGKGLFAQFLENLEGKEQKIDCVVGNLDFIQEFSGQAVGENVVKHVKELQENLSTVVLLYSQLGISVIGLKDMIREEVKSMLKELKQRGISPWMLTGDHEKNARFVGGELGIKHVLYDLKPKDKLQEIERLSVNQSVAMVGDGINDAPALAKAHVGIAMGTIGSGAATYAADVILLHDEIAHLPWLFSKAKQTQKIVMQNLSLALIAIILASAGALAGVIPMWLAVLAHEGGTIIVGLNGLRLLSSK